MKRINPKAVGAQIKTVTRSFALFAALIVLAISYLPMGHVSASLAPCTANVSPTSVLPGSQTVFEFAVVNNDANEDIRYVHILKPSANFEVVDGYNNGWDIVSDSDQVTFLNGSIEPGGSQILQVEAIAGGSDASAASWSVSVTDQSDGSDNVGCVGSNSTSISSQAPFAISGVTAKSITSTSATITWITNRPATSKVSYGKTTSYGQSAEVNDGTLRTQHSVNLTNLQPNTTYHFRTSSVASGNQSINSVDNTFFTPLPPVTPTAPTGTTSVADPASQVSLISNPFIKATPTESVPPSINSRTVLQKVYTDSPRIEGEATDNAEVAMVEYSIDGGQNWLIPEQIAGLGTGRVTFSFTPKNLEDGNYDIALRATDSSRNQTTKILGTIVIDKLPPIVGGTVMSIGTQATKPDADGTVRAVAGVDQKVVMSAVGGATSLNIEVYRDKSAKPSQTFGLSRSTATGLWSGIMSFTEGGEFELRVRAVDGADNQTNRVVGKVIVSEKGKVTDAGTRQMIAAEVYVNYKDPQTGAWIPWSGTTYGQSNPAESTENSGYGFYLPAGTYYLKVVKKGYYPATTQSFTLDNPGSVSSNITLHKAPGFSIGSTRVQPPSWRLSKITINQPQQESASKAQTKSKALPVFDLAQTDGSRIKTVELYGKPVVISLVSTWSPGSQDQLPILAELAKEYPELKIIPVGSGESISRLVAQSNIGGYKLPIAADVNNSLLNSLGSANLPTHYFIDRRGMVVKHVVGVLSKEEILKNVAN